MEYIENIKRPVKKGELFLVPCIVKRDKSFSNDQRDWIGLSDKDNRITHIMPVINHPHSDRENGQPEIHYHLDYRFIKHRDNSNFPTVINRHSSHVYGEVIRPTNKDGELEYHILPVINEEFTGVTPVHLIKNSKLKHKCIHKGKCPHRGYDLSQVKSIDGVKTCPLHGLKFNDKGLLI